tara:strand:+ start:187 stop:426 length:240 start_codon:yes stop_codon:yes gene_type:complete
MQTLIQKQILEWKEELKVHKERLDQAKTVVEQENRFIAMIEGGIQAQEMLLQKIEQESQPTDTTASQQPEQTKSSKSKA